MSKLNREIEKFIDHNEELNDYYPATEPRELGRRSACLSLKEDLDTFRRTFGSDLDFPLISWISIADEEVSGRVSFFQALQELYDRRNNEEE